MITFQCAECGKRLRAERGQAGQRAKCSGCGKVNTVPDAAPPVRLRPPPEEEPGVPAVELPPPEAIPDEPEPLAEEEVFLSARGVTVTDRRLIVGDETYVLGHITAVALIRDDKPRRWLIRAAVVFGLVFLVLLWFGAWRNSFFYLSLLLTIVSGFLARLAEPATRLRWTTTSGETKLLDTKGVPRIEDVYEALTAAIVSRG